MKHHKGKKKLFSPKKFSQTFFGQLGRSHNEKVLSHFYSNIIRKSFDQILFFKKQKPFGIDFNFLPFNNFLINTVFWGNIIVIRVIDFMGHDKGDFSLFLEGGEL